MRRASQVAINRFRSGVEPHHPAESPQRDLFSAVILQAFYDLEHGATNTAPRGTSGATLADYMDAKRFVFGPDIHLWSDMIPRSSVPAIRDRARTLMAKRTQRMTKNNQRRRDKTHHG